MSAFGERLRREREMRGITLDEISESTKISRRHLESLEREDFDALPGGIFNKGFVRAYARYLGLDEDQAVADYSSVSGETPPPVDRFPLEIHEKDRDRELNPRRSPIPLVLALLALIAVLALLWARNRARRVETHPPSPPAPAASNNTPQADSLPEAVSPTPDSASPMPVNPTPVPSAVNTGAGSTFLVIVKAKEDSWVRLTADGKETWAGVMKANTHRLVRAARRIVVTTGNAGGIEVSHNGRSLGALGSESEVRTLTFNAGGLVP